MHVYLMTDLEGVAGIVNFEDYCRPESKYYENARRLLTNEVNAVAEGLFAGGADAVTVFDGHGPGAINCELLDARLRYDRGARSRMYPWGLDEGFDVFAIVGQHAKSGTPYSHLTHTSSFYCYDLRVNDYSIGEYGALVLCARELGIPVIFAAGEEAFCREAQDLTPGVITAAVKRGTLPDDHSREITVEQYAKSKLGANHMSPAGARQLLRKQAQNAMETYFSSREQFRYREIHAPYALLQEMRASDNVPEKTAIRQTTSFNSFIEAINCLINTPFDDIISKRTEIV